MGRFVDLVQPSTSAFSGLPARCAITGMRCPADRLLGRTEEPDSSYFGILGECQGVFHVHPQIADGVFNLRVS